ncbi:MAG: DMT family transporter [Rhodocyclaceae bacterium]|nr:DMT family transporter [Rhodocyclaceae bacterium]
MSAAAARAKLTPATLAFLLLPPLFWAGNAVIGRAMVGQLPPMALSFWRWAIAFLLILPFTARGMFAARAEIRARRYDLLVFGVAGVGVYNSFQYLALQTSPALNVTLIASSGPVFTLLAGALFFHAPVSRRQAGGALLSIAGVLWVVARGSVEQLVELRLTPGDGYILFAIAVWSIYTWLLRTRRPQIPAATFLAVQIGIGAIAILPFYLVERAWTGIEIALNPPVLLTLAYVGLLPSLAAYFCWDRAVARTGATLPAYFVNLTPIFAALLAVPFLGERIAGFHLVGALLIFAGIAIANRPVAART